MKSPFERTCRQADEGVTAWADQGEREAPRHAGHRGRGLGVLIGAAGAAIFLSGCAHAGQPATRAAPPVNVSLAPPQNAAQAAAFDSYMRAAVENAHFSGTVLVAKNGVPIFSESYGMANYELDAPFEADTVFNVASLTKQFTAMALMQLQERGRLNVHDSVCVYLKECPESWRPITLHHLVTHTSGIPNYSSLPDWDDQGATRDYKHGELVETFRDLPLQFEPGEKYSYSNSGYQLLGHVVERASGRPFGAYLEANIFRPLGMNSTTFNNTRDLVENRASGYYSLGTSLINPTLHSPTVLFGDAGVFTTAGDLLIWDQALYTEQLISRRGLDQIFTPYLDGYAYGWRVSEKFGRRNVSHAGSSQGFSSFISRFPEDQLTVVVLSNSDQANATSVSVNLAAIHFGEPHATPRASLHDILWDEIAENGVSAAIARYRELQGDQSSGYDFSEDETLVGLGYTLYTANRLAESQQIFEFALSVFPRSAYSYDGLADIALSLGDPEAARRNFRISLELDPENEYAIRGLEREASR